MIKKNISVSPGDHFSEFADDCERSGCYNTKNDVVRAGLLRLEEQEAKRNTLIVEQEKGERSGPSKAFDFNAFLDRRRKSMA